VTAVLSSPELATDIFISYSSDDAHYAAHLSDALKELGYSVWRDQDIPARGVWHTELVQNLSGAKCVVVLWSARSAEKEWVRYEAAYAMGRKRYLGCRIENGVSLPTPFSQTQDIALFGWTGDLETAGFPKLLDEVAGMVERPPKREVTLRRFDQSWPEKIPRPFRQLVWTWLKRNLIVLVAILTMGLALAVVYFALGSRLAQLNAGMASLDKSTEGLKTSAAQTKESAEKTNESVGKTKESVQALRSDVTAINKLTGSLSTTVDGLNRQVSNIQTIATRLARASTPITTLTIGFVFSSSPTTGVLFGESGVLIGHGGRRLCTIKVQGSSEDSSRTRDPRADFHGFLQGSIGFGEDDYPFREPFLTAAGYSGGTFDEFLRTLGPPLEGGNHLIVLRINTEVMRRLTKGSWPFLQVRDLDSASIYWNENRGCDAIFVGVNEVMWVGTKIRGHKAWSNIGRDLIESGVQSTLWRQPDRDP
jgi:uncharacterized protein YoxC